MGARRRSRVLLLLAAAGSLALAGPWGSADAAPAPSNSPDVEGHNANITYADASGYVHVVRIDDVNDPAVRADAGDVIISRGPKAYGTPTGYMSAIDPAHPQEHVVYRAATGHLYNLWKVVGDTKWNRTDMRARADATARAVGDSVGWSHDSLGRQWVVYRADGGQIHGLTWLKKTGQWSDVNLSVAARTKALAMADPTMFVDGTGASARPVIVYRSKDKHVHLLVWNVGPSGNAWHDSDVSTSAHFTGQALGKPSGWSSTAPATSLSELHVVFRTSSGHVEELYGGKGRPWRRKDLTLASRATVTAVSDVQGTIGSNAMAADFETVQYTGSDGDLHELDFAPDAGTGPRIWKDTNLAVTTARLGLWFQDGLSAYSVWVTSGHLWALERDWASEVSTITDLTTLTGSTTPPTSSTGGYFTPSL